MEEGSESTNRLGQLAAGIGHEINNPLAFICSNISVLERYVSKLTPLLEHIQTLSDEKTQTLLKELDLSYMIRDLPLVVSESKEGIDRIRLILSGLRRYAYDPSSEWGEVDLESEIGLAVRMLPADLREDRVVEVDMDALPSIGGYPGQLGQVFLNLVLNAAQAVERGGKIQVSAHSDEANLSVKIADEGEGIPESVVERIFEPFFSTKGRGTGLGLSISKEIVERHGGKLVVETELGKGTAFTVLLPRPVSKEGNNE